MSKRNREPDTLDDLIAIEGETGVEFSNSKVSEPESIEVRSSLNEGLQTADDESKEQTEEYDRESIPLKCSCQTNLELNHIFLPLIHGNSELDPVGRRPFPPTAQSRDFGTLPIAEAQNFDEPH